jgi:cystathionine beta-synthase
MDFSLVDDYVQVDDKTSMRMTRRLAREEGLFVGQSCGMAVAGALDWLRAHEDELSEEDVVVILLPDSGFRYLSKTYNDEWMRRNGFLEEPDTLTLEDVLAVRPRAEAVIGVAPDDTLASAIEAMTAHGISQVPVLDGDEVVGSLNERGVLHRLIAQPEARDEPVREAMGAPLPVVSASVHLDELTATLDGDAGAVLVRAEAGGFDILTRSDLIAALARNGRPR